MCPVGLLSAALPMLRPGWREAGLHGRMTRHTP